MERETRALVDEKYGGDASYKIIETKENLKHTCIIRHDADVVDKKDIKEDNKWKIKAYFSLIKSIFNEKDIYKE